MIGYLIEQELGNLLPFEVPFATILTMVEVDPDDPAFDNPTKFIGPGYDEADARKLEAEHGWKFGLDGERWRRVVPSPAPTRIFEHRPIKWLLEKGTIVICAGGGGIPTMYEQNGTRTLVGAEVIVDKDRASALLAREIEADVFVMATDVDGVYLDWGTPDARRLERTTPAELRALDFPAGSMGPKVEAACDFVERTGGMAAIGALADIEAIVDGRDRHSRPARIDRRRSPAAAEPASTTVRGAMRRSSIASCGRAVLLAAGASAFGIDTDQPPPPGVVGTPYSFTSC